MHLSLVLSIEMADILQGYLDGRIHAKKIEKNILNFNAVIHREVWNFVAMFGEKNIEKNKQKFLPGVMIVQADLQNEFETVAMQIFAF